MDRRTLLAIVLSAVVLILLPVLFEKLGLTPKRTPRAPIEEPAGEAPAEPRTPGQPDAQQGVAGTGGDRAQIGIPPPAGTAPGPGATPEPLAIAPAFPALSAQPGQDSVVRGELYDAFFNSVGARLLSRRAHALFTRHSSASSSPASRSAFTCLIRL